MATVRDFKRHALARAGGSYYFEFDDGKLDRVVFWSKLNKLGNRFFEKGGSVADVPDIDAVVELTDTEWVELERELDQLLGSAVS